MEKMKLLLIKYTKEKETIKYELECGILSPGEAQEEMNALERKEINLKIRMAKSVHVTNTGVPRIIKYREDKALFTTLMPGKRQVACESEEGLYLKLFELYGLEIKQESYTVKSVWGKALERKIIKRDSAEDTITRDKADFKRFISDDFANMDIKSVTGDFLEDYTNNLLSTQNVKKKAFYAYKGVLNLIFDYAIYCDIITKNPVNKIINSEYVKKLEQTVATAENKTLSQTDIQKIRDALIKRRNHGRYNGYDIMGYAILFATYTGARAGEIPALKWQDVGGSCIHFHAQQRDTKDGYVYIAWTKDEKGVSKNGRKFPISGELRKIISEIRDLQMDLGINSEYVFANFDGDWIKKDAYETAVRRLLASLGFEQHHNHLFRMSLNTKLASAGIAANRRAAILGHSVATNLNNYTYDSLDADNDDIIDVIDDIPDKTVRSYQGHTIRFALGQKKKRERLDFKHFLASL